MGLLSNLGSAWFEDVMGGRGMLTVGSVWCEEGMSIVEEGCRRGEERQDWMRKE